MHPRLPMMTRMIVAGIESILGVLVVVLASYRAHAVGIALGVVGILAGAATLVLEWVKRMPKRDSTAGTFSNLDGDSESTSSNKTGGAVKRCCGMTPLGWLGLANGVLTVLLLLIAVVACVTPDPDVTAFPSECPPGLPIGCSRVAVLNSHRTGGVEPLEVRGVELGLVTDAFKSTAEKAGGRLLYRGAIADGSAGEFQHYRFISTLFGFPDDLFARVSLTAEEAAVLVEVQGQLRIGYGDMDVNTNRNIRLLRSVKEATSGAA